MEIRKFIVIYFFLIFFISFARIVWRFQKVIRIGKSKNDRQRNDQKKKENKQTNNDLQNITQKTKDLATHTLTKNQGWMHVLRKNKQVLLCLHWFKRYCFVVLLRSCFCRFIFILHSFAICTLLPTEHRG